MSIARDINGVVSSSGSSATKSLTIGAGATLLLAFVDLEGSADIVTGVTWNGNAMTKLASIFNADSGQNEGGYIYGILNPTSGTHNLVASCSTTLDGILFGISYTGTDSSTLPSVTTIGKRTTAGDIALTLNLPVANCWVAGMGSNDWANGIAMDANHPKVDNNPTGTSRCSFDSNGVIASTGNNTATVTIPVGSGGAVALSCVILPSKVAPTVTTQAVSSITNTTAIGNGNVTADGGATVTERGVCIGATSNPTTAGTKFSTSGTTGAFTVAMTSLTKNTHYHARAYAINSIGTSYGSDVEFTTTNIPNELRDFTNKPGAVYDVNKTTVIYAEDLALIKEWIEYLNNK